MKIENNTNLLNYYLMCYILFNESYIQHYRNKFSKQIIQDNQILKKNNTQVNNLICDKNLPFCLFTNKIDNIVNLNQFYVLRCNRKIKFYKDYFSEEFEKDLENFTEKKITIDDLLIEYQIHICP